MVANTGENLEALADKANFESFISPHALLGRGIRISDVIKTEANNAFYISGNEEEGKPYGDMTILTFNNPEDYLGAKTYNLSKEKIIDAVRTGNEINLSERNPDHVGDAAIDMLRTYFSLR